jgi:peptidoglycan/xylan/chitin deacetylase (PgdA/CDA1 family)
LDALARAAVKATFFVVAEQIAESDGPAILRAIRDAGHAVQAHCGRHSDHANLDLLALRSDAGDILNALAANGVCTPRLWRPPYGSLHPRLSHQVAVEMGLQIVLWTHDTFDWRGTPAAAMLAAARAAPLYGDSVVLMHDSRRYCCDKDVSPTVDLIEPLASLVRSRGLEMGRLTEPLASRPLRSGEFTELVPLGPTAEN